MSIVFRNTPLTVTRRARSVAEHPLVGAALLAVAIAVTVVIVATTALHRSEGLHFATHEFGIVAQLTANLRHGRLTLTVDAPEGGGAAKTFLRAPGALLLLTAVQARGANPALLLIAQAIALALGAWPIYLLALHHLHGRIRSLALAGAYLLFPALSTLALNGFSTSVFAIVPLLFAMLAFDRNKNRQAFGWLACATFMRWEALFVALGIGVMLAVTRDRRRIGLVLSGATAALLIVGLAVSGRYTGLPPNPIGSAHDWGEFAMPLLVLLGLPLFSVPGLFVGLPLVLLHALNAGAGWQQWYVALSFAPLFIGLIAGIRTFGRIADRLAPRQDREKPPHAIYRAATFAVLLSCVLWSALAGSWPTAGGYDPRVDHLTDHERRAVAFFEQVPTGASLSAQDNLAPQLANRRELARFPRLDDAAYVLLDVYTAKDAGLPPAEYIRSVVALLENPAYGVAAERDGYLLMQRGLPQQPVSESLATLYALSFPNKAFMYEAGRVLTDPNARHGEASVAVAPVDGAGFLATKLQVALPAGSYTATFRLRPGWTGDTNLVAVLDVIGAESGISLVRREVTGADFRSTDYQEISVSFTVSSETVSPRIYWSGRTELWFDSLSIAPTTDTIAQWRVTPPR